MAFTFEERFITLVVLIMKSLITLGVGIICVIFFAIHSQAQTNQNPFFSSSGKWVKASNTNCLIWSSFPKDSESVTWLGPIVDGKGHGKGIVQWFTNGIPTTKFEGELKAGISHGRGISSGNGISFEGDWRNGQLDEKLVKITYPNGNWYKGEFRDASKSGLGEETMPGGQKYVGQFKDGRFNGQGEVLTANGDKLSGVWKDSKLDGVGTYKTKAGEEFKVKMTDTGLEKL